MFNLSWQCSIQKRLLYIFPESHLVICCCCRMSEQTAVQKWQCPGVGSQNWLSGCQREEAAKRERESAVSQVVPPVDRPAGGGREGACLDSFHTASLNWCFQSRNVSSFGTCFVCLCFQHTSRLHGGSSPCSSLENAKTCARAHTCVYAGLILSIAAEAIPT